MPRRQALKIIAGMISSTALATLFPGHVWAGMRSDAKDVLNLPVSELSMQDVEVVRILQTLQYQFQAPINFIQAGEDNPTTVDVVNGTVRDVLQQITSQNPRYYIREVGGRLILMPRNPLFDKAVEGVGIANLPRLEAFRAYVATLKESLAGFEEIIDAAMIGNPEHSMAASPITLSPRASVLGHLVELLGTDDTTLFALQKCPGGYLLWLSNVVQSPRQILQAVAAADQRLALQAPPPPCRVISITEAPVAGFVANCVPPFPAGTLACGGQVDLTAVVTCPGDNCVGAIVQEQLNVNVDTCGFFPRPGFGLGCVVGAGGALTAPPPFPPGTPCRDTMLWCFPPAALNGGCCDFGWQQSIWAPNPPGPGISAVETCTIRFHFCNPMPANCFTRTCQNTYTALSCCTLPAPVGPTLCPPGQICVNGNQCCPTAQACRVRTVCCPAGQVCVNDTTCCPAGAIDVCNNACCPAGQVCVTPGGGNPAACCPQAQACNGATVCCPAGQVCVNGNTCCPQGAIDICNAVCCPGGQVCVTPGGGNPPACCPLNQACSVRTVCCPAGQVCVGGNQCCPAGVTAFCAGACCPPGDFVCANNACCPRPRACRDNTLCCPAGQTCINNNQCCPAGVTTICAARCCPPGNFVCTTNGICCPAAQVCNGGQTCCPVGQNCVGGTTCCPAGVTTACNFTCCPAGNFTCINGACCPTPRACVTNTVCCPVGQLCAANVCCPQAQACGAVCCPNGQVCIAGACCPQARACGNVCCPAAQVCNNGVCCAPAKVCGAACCPDGQDCVNGACCDTGKVCNGTCCTDLQLCINGACCDLGQVCISVCCPATQSCVNGACCDLPSVCNGTCCAPGQSCVNGACVDNCGGVICPPGQVCVNGVCCDQARVCNGTCCPPGTMCQSSSPSGSGMSSNVAPIPVCVSIA
jgi:hypothetical protein